MAIIDNIAPDFIKQSVQYWAQVAPLLEPIRSELDYERAVLILDQILDLGGANEHDPLASLANLLGEKIAHWENKTLTLPDVSPAELLQFLMAQHQLVQSDLSELGSQGVVSELLSKKRQFNTRQIRALCDRFGTNADVWL